MSGTKIAGAHLDVISYPSDSGVAAGNRFAVAVQIEPHTGVHVYAPGASGYRAIALTITPPSFVRVLPPAFPKSEIYFFRPLNERVPVFQKPFTLAQELVLEGTPEAQAAFKGKESLTLTGSLDYQACDDKTCFNPVSLPLTWTIGLKRL